MGCLKCSGLVGNVPGYVPGFEIMKPLRHKACSDRSGRSDLTARVRSVQRMAHMRTSTRKTLARVDIYPEHSEHMEQHRNGKDSGRSGVGTEPGTFALNPEHRQMTTKPGNLRAEMPTVAGWIDDLRAAFGAEQINAAIRAGLDGQPTFYASENGRAVGTKSKGEGVALSQTVIAPLFAPVQTGRGGK